MRPHDHHFLVPTMDPDFRRCSKLGCRAISRVSVTRPAPAVESSTTSVAAARAIEGTARQRTRMLVYQTFQKFGEDGLTDDEGVMETGMNPNTYRPRRIELERDNLVFDSGARRPTKSGREAVVWVARPAN